MAAARQATMAMAPALRAASIRRRAVLQEMPGGGAGWWVGVEGEREREEGSEGRN